MLLFQQENRSKMKVEKFIYVSLVIVSLINIIRCYDTKEFSSKEMHAEFIQRFGDYKWHIYKMCFSFDSRFIITPGFDEKVDNDYWYELCFNLRRTPGYFKNFYYKARTRILKEVKAEFEKKKETKTEN